MSDHETLVDALIAAQAGFRPILKDATNPHFRSKYADLPSILEAVNPALREHGLVCVQRGKVHDGQQILVTELLHDSGQTLASDMLMPTQSDPQKMGSALTYFRRYALLALLGIAPDDDDDGNAASRSSPNQRQQTPPRPQQSAPAQQAQANDVRGVPLYPLDGKSLKVGDWLNAAIAKAKDMDPGELKWWWESKPIKDLRKRMHMENPSFERSMKAAKAIVEDRIALADAPKQPPAANGVERARLGGLA